MSEPEAGQGKRDRRRRHLVRVLGDTTSRRDEVHVVPDTNVIHQLADGIEVVPILPGSAYDRGQPTIADWDADDDLVDDLAE